MKKLFQSLLLSTTFLFPAFSQSISQAPDQLPGRLKKYIQQSPVEKAYLHLNKFVFSPGESIWFKAYMVNGSTHVAGSLSTILYVNLFDQESKILESRNIKIADGFGKGDFRLADSLESGTYFIEAHTNYMRNAEPEYFFKKEIKVLDREKVRNAEQSQASHPGNGPQILLTFYPEGGEMVNGLPGRVACKAEDAQGKPLTIDGKIINSKGDQTSSFSTHKLGLGDFVLTPSASDEYYSALVHYQGVNFSFRLPESKESGFTLQINNHNNKIYVKALHSQPGGLNASFILGHLRGIPIALIEGEKNEQQLYSAISTENIPSGIVHFTLFDKQGVPQCERLVFINNPDKKLDLSITSDKSTYGKREKAHFRLNLRNQEGSAVAGNLSVTAVDYSLLPVLQDAGNIKSYLLLSSDLKGKIENPAYYFNPDHKDRHYLLDLLMLTHGWRRFTWNEVLKGPKEQPAFLPENGFTIKGQLFDYYRRNKSVTGTVKFMVLEDPLVNQKDSSFENGQFSFSGLHFLDSATVLLQANKWRKKDRKGNDAIFIQVDKGQAYPFGDSLLLSLSKSKRIADGSGTRQYMQKANKINAINAAYSDSIRAIVLEEVAVESVRHKRDNPFYQPGQLYFSPSKRLVIDSIPAAEGALTVFDVLHGRVAGVRVVGVGINKTAHIRSTFRPGSSEALFLLDGMPLDNQQINGVQVSDVAYIDILRGTKASIYGREGVIAIYTRQETGITAAPAEIPGIINFTHPGYYRAREFYSPNYEKEENQNPKPDFRHTLYWNPEVVIDESGCATVSFFTSDEKNNYVLLIEGIAADGRLFTAEQPFEVN